MSELQSTYQLHCEACGDPANEAGTLFRMPDMIEVVAVCHKPGCRKHIKALTGEIEAEVYTGPRRVQE